MATACIAVDAVACAAGAVTDLLAQGEILPVKAAGERQAGRTVHEHSALGAGYILAVLVGRPADILDPHILGHATQFHGRLVRSAEPDNILTVCKTVFHTLYGL